MSTHVKSFFSPNVFLQFTLQGQKGEPGELGLDGPPGEDGIDVSVSLAYQNVVFFSKMKECWLMSGSHSGLYMALM